ncbi:MAG TPA: MarR family transcriptional regulator [Acidimicrobiales bacterium]|nr:MarR family transcriptional regulator [Acidimicrobiales bacterium]
MTTTGTAPDRVTEEIAAALSSVARVVNQVKVHETLCKRAGVDLDRAGAALVYKLYTEGENMRLTELAERLAIDPPAVTRKVQQLERDGLLLRSVDPVDARALRIKLTREGRRAIERLLQARQRWLDDVLQQWPDADRRELARLLQLLATSVVADQEPAHGH